MALHNLTATRVREPGFSPSECLELARKLEAERLWLFGDGGNEANSPRAIATIVAALRAYAE
jgi:hypothetical protein